MVHTKIFQRCRGQTTRVGCLFPTKGFCQVRKIQKSEKNSEMGGSVKPQLGFVFFLEILCFLCCFFVVVHVSEKNGYLGSGQFEFFSVFGFFLTWQNP